eukprot:5486229-Prymnesium_polylepis.1
MAKESSGPSGTRYYHARQRPSPVCWRGGAWDHLTNRMQPFCPCACLLSGHAQLQRSQNTRWPIVCDVDTGRRGLLT